MAKLTPNRTYEALSLITGSRVRVTVGVDEDGSQTFM